VKFTKTKGWDVTALCIFRDRIPSIKHSTAVLPKAVCQCENIYWPRVGWL